MSSFIKRVGNWLSGDFDDGYDDYEEGNDGYSDTEYNTSGSVAKQPIAETIPDLKAFEPSRKRERRTEQRSSDGGKVLNMHNGVTKSQVIFVQPKSFSNDVKGISNHVLNNCTVIINLEKISSYAEGRRLIDFITGVAYAVKARAESTGEDSVTIVPACAEFSGDFLVETDEFDTEGRLY